jgi:phage gpG-like protein
VTVKVEGLPRLRATMRALEGSIGRSVVVGVLGSDGQVEHDGEIGTNPKRRPTVIDVATWHEFGVPAMNIPARSFLRATLTARRADIIRRVGLELRAVVTAKRPVAQAWERVGLAVQGMVQQRIADGIPPPLKSREGTPLIQTGQLRSSITYEVRT